MNLFLLIGCLIVGLCVAGKVRDPTGKSADDVCVGRQCGQGMTCEPYRHCPGGCLSWSRQWRWIAACRPDYTDPSLCTYALDAGNCEAYFPSYGFDVDKGRCVRFIYGGCGGNGNRFQTLRSCMAHCQI